MKEFIVKVIMELVDMVNNGIISFVVTVAATRYMTKDKTYVCRIKERANVSQTSTHDDISESHSEAPPAIQRMTSGFQWWYGDRHFVLLTSHDPF